MKTAIFLLGSVGLIILSRHALMGRRTHGFPRFFAFEAFLGLLVLNSPYWFTHPFSLPQIFSWIFLLTAGILVILAVYSLRQHGAPDSSLSDATRIYFEKTTQLVTTGPYRYIRHPMYASLLCLTCGALLKHMSLVTVLLTVIAALALFLTAIYEEQENLHYFGDEYAALMKRTKRFIPFLF